MGSQKKLRQGQILKLIESKTLTSQDELRRALHQSGFRVTQATLSRDLHELNVAKGPEGYRGRPPPTAKAVPAPSLPQLLREFLLDLRPAQNLLVLKTPPGGAQPLAIALDTAEWKEVAGTIAGDDTILVITLSARARATVERRLKGLL